MPDQTGRVIVITGANTGIGFEAARVLASRGGRVLLGCRSEPKANEAMDRIRALHPAAQVEWLALDLASLASVRSAAEQLQQEPFLDLLINNAGVMVPPRSRPRMASSCSSGSITWATLHSRVCCWTSWPVVRVPGL